jgi:hypothetical protein
MDTVIYSPRTVLLMCSESMPTTPPRPKTIPIRYRERNQGDGVFVVRDSKARCIEYVHCAPASAFDSLDALAREIWMASYASVSQAVQKDSQQDSTDCEWNINLDGLDDSSDGAQDQVSPCCDCDQPECVPSQSTEASAEIDLDLPILYASDAS